MRDTSMLLAILAAMLVVVLISGCTEPISGRNSITTSEPVPLAVDLNEQGYSAFINGNYSRALDLYNQSMTVDPKYTRVLINKGDVLLKLNRTSEAISSYDSALSLENNLAVVWNKRGEALMTTGNYTAARDSFDRALQIAPEYAAAKENRDIAQKKIPLK